MPWHVKHNESLQAVEVKLAGVVSGEELIECTVQGIRLATELELNRGLIDANDQEQTARMLELLDMPSLYAAEGLQRAIRIAMVIPNRIELHEVARFYETVCVNRGWSVRNFENRDDAIEWLTDRE